MKESDELPDIGRIGDKGNTLYLIIMFIAVILGLSFFVGYAIMKHGKDIPTDTLYPKHIHVQGSDTLYPGGVTDMGPWNLSKPNQKPKVKPCKCDTIKYVKQVKEITEYRDSLVSMVIYLSAENQELRTKIILLKNVIEEQTQIINKLAPSAGMMDTTLFKLHYGYYSTRYTGK